AKNMPTTHSLQPWTYHCLFGLLAVTGLRISEALNLRSTDVDWSEGILTIRNSKFGKSRLIPLQASSLKILSDYGARRDLLFAKRKTPYFFCSRYDGRLDEGQVRRVFYMISRQIGIRGAWPATDRVCTTFVIVSQSKRCCAGIAPGKMSGGVYPSYLRQNFWPLREFTDLHDVNRQVQQWLSEVANRRLHSETRERPLDRFKPEALRPLPIIPYDYRDSTEALVHKDLRLSFDGNRYCVPHRYVGRRLTIKADSGAVTIYDRVEEVVSYARSWRRGQTFGAERFERLLAEERPAARRSQAQQRLLDSLDGLCLRATVEAYLRDMADTDRSLSRQIQELLELIRQYGPEDVAGAIERAASARAFGAEYVANILRQQRSPRRPQPPLRLRDPLLNELSTDPISLREYDAFILESGKKPDDPSRTETAATEPESDEPTDRGDDR
ncbi:MAG: tyrosine-type recombinase/integrase, partial [Bryobacteraceae bacterium]